MSNTVQKKNPVAEFFTNLGVQIKTVCKDAVTAAKPVLTKIGTAFKGLGKAASKVFSNKGFLGCTLIAALGVLASGVISLIIGNLLPLIVVGIVAALLIAFAAHATHKENQKVTTVIAEWFH
jgi:hypothetical protein